MDFSVIVPAYNEEQLLARTLTTLKDAVKPLNRRAEIIVVDNNSTDKTAAIARGQGAKVVFEPHNQISRARNTGAHAAHGTYLFFLDADTLVTTELFEQALARLDTGAVGGGARVRYDQPVTGLPMLATNLWNWVSEHMGLAAGCFFFCRHEAFDDAGGFSESVYASEELWLSKTLQKWGRQRNRPFVILTEEGPATSARKFTWFSPLQFAWYIALTFIPFGVYSRSLCRFWYQRPR